VPDQELDLQPLILKSDGLLIAPFFFFSSYTANAVQGCCKSINLPMMKIDC